MFTTIVVATDLSAASDRVIACLPGLKPLGAKRVHLVHALGLRHLDTVKYELARFVEPRLLQQEAALQVEGFETSVEIAAGIPELEVNRIAHERHASLIALGSHGATLAREVLVGGVALAILHRAVLPVLVLRLRLTEDNKLVKCDALCADFSRHILYPTDFSDTAERAFGYLEKMVESGAKRVTLLHVQDKARISPHLTHKLEEFNRIDTERLHRHCEALRKLGATEVNIELPYGSPIQEILRVARERGVSEIVMGSQGRGFIAEVFLGSVSHQVARHAPVPVLFVPAERDQM
jgi:nucleotide-binding universal stress UspA family protein